MGATLRTDPVGLSVFHLTCNSGWESWKAAGVSYCLGWGPAAAAGQRYHSRAHTLAVTARQEESGGNLKYPCWPKAGGGSGLKAMLKAGCRLRAGRSEG